MIHNGYFLGKPALYAWFSELNYYMTKYRCSSLDELSLLLTTYGVLLIIL